MLNGRRRGGGGLSSGRLHPCRKEIGSHLRIAMIAGNLCSTSLSYLITISHMFFVNIFRHTIIFHIILE